MRTSSTRSSAWRPCAAGAGGHRRVVHLAGDAAAAPGHPVGCRALRPARSDGVDARIDCARRAPGEPDAGGRRGPPQYAATPDPGRPAAHRADRPRPGAGPTRRASSASRASRGRSSCRSTCRAAWPPRTWSRAAWRPPRPPLGRSSRASRRSILIGVVAFSDTGFSMLVPDRRPGAGPRGDRPAGARARDIDRPRDRLLADRDRGRRAGPRGRLLHEPLAGSRSAAPGRSARDASPRRRSSCSPTARTTSGRTRSKRRGPRPSAGVRIFTVGLGTEEGTTLEVEGFRVHSRLDEPSLRRIAELTDGAYYAAADPAELASIYDDIETRFVIRPEATEVTSLFAGAGVAAPPRGCGGGAPLAGATAVMDLLAPGAFLLLVDRPDPRRRPDLAAPAPEAGAALLEPLARPGGRRPVRRGSAGICRSPCSRSVSSSLVVAMARPVQIVSVPAGRTTVILAMDVSRSMCATDIPPNRLLAAEDGRRLVHRSAGRDARRSASSRSPVSPRSSRRRRRTRRCCSTSSRA